MPDDLVQNVAIQGEDQVVGSLDKMGTAGEANFDKIAAAAERAAPSLEKAGTAAEDAGTKTAAGLANAGANAQHLQKVEQAANTFGRSLANVGSSVASFTGQLGQLGVAAGKIGALILFARAIASQVSAASNAANSTRLLNQQLKANQQSQTQAAIAAVNNQAALRDLNNQLLDGTLTAEQYGTQLLTLTRSQQQNEETTRRIAFIEQSATESRLRDVAAIQKQREQTEAFNAVADKFGGQLATSLIRLGSAADSIFKSFQQTFGPIVAGFIDKLTALIENNRTAIVNFFETIASAIKPVLDQGGQDLQGFVQQIIGAAQTAATVFKAVVIPAFQAFLGFLNIIAGAINSIFGTNLTGAGLLVIVVIGQLTGALGLLWNVVGVGTAAIKLLTAAFGPWGLVIALVTAALIFLVTQIDWKQLATLAKAALDATTKFFTDFWDWVKSNATGVWNFFADAAQSAIDKVKGFIQPLIDALKSLWEWAKKAFSAIGGFGGSTGSAGAGSAPLGLARGGLVRGPGTTTSDSIWARLSKDEFVLNAAAVRRYGLGTLYAMNQLRANLPRFSAGGFVGALSASMIPRLASGGQVGVARISGRPIVLNFGDDSFTVFAKEQNTADRLGRFATKRRVAQSGRKPSYYGA